MKQYSLILENSRAWRFTFKVSLGGGGGCILLFILGLLDGWMNRLTVSVYVYLSFTLCHPPTIRRQWLRARRSPEGTLLAGGGAQRHVVHRRPGQHPHPGGEPQPAPAWPHGIGGDQLPSGPGALPVQPGMEHGRVCGGAKYEWILNLCCRKTSLANTALTCLCHIFILEETTVYNK